MADQPGAAAPAEFTGNSDRNPDRRRIVLVARNSADKDADSPALELPLNTPAAEKLSPFTKWGFTFIEAGDDWAESIVVYIYLNNRFGGPNKINDHVMKKTDKFPDVTAHKIAVGKELQLESEWAKLDPEGTSGHPKVLISLCFAVRRILAKKERKNPAPETAHDHNRLTVFLDQATVYATAVVQKLQETARDIALHGEKVEEIRQLVRAVKEAANGLPEELVFAVLRNEFPKLSSTARLREDSDLAALLRHVKFLQLIPAATWTKVMEDFTLMKIQDVFNRPAGQPSLL